MKMTKKPKKFGGKGNGGRDRRRPRRDPGSGGVMLSNEKKNTLLLNPTSI